MSGTNDIPGTQLQRRLSAFDTLLLTLSCLSPVFSVYGVGSDVLHTTGSGAAVLFLIGIGAALIWAVVYAELGSAYPYSGGDYVGVGAILGPAAGFVCLALWAAILAPNNAFVAKMVGTYVQEVVPGAPSQVIAFGSVAVATGLALLNLRTNALVTGTFLAVEMLAVLALIAAGFWHAGDDFSRLWMHPLVPRADGHWVPVALGTMAMGAVSAAFATVGGNQAIAFGEELVDPHRRMGRVIFWACLSGAIAIALPVIAVALHVGRDARLFHSAAPFSAFFAAMAGPAAGRALSAAVALALFNALIASVLFAARLIFSFARDGIFPARVNAALVNVHAPSGAPRRATLCAGVVTLACTALSAHVLLVFLAGFVVYALALVSFAVLVGRRRGLTGSPGFWRSPLFPLAPVAGLALAVSFALADWADSQAGRPSLIALGAVLLVALMWHRLVLMRRPGGWAPQLGARPPAV